jgi:quinol monooxygenase YgiN
MRYECAREGTMLVIAGRIAVKPERREEAVRAALAMAAATREEEGCLSYRFYGDLEDPCVFLIFEEWRDDAALGAHFGMPHMAEFLAKVQDLVAAPPTITRYEVASAAPL